MKSWLKTLLGRFREPKWRHGKLSTLLTLGFVTVCVLLNIAVASLEEEYGWTRDMSFNGYATTGKETERLLAQVDTKVELYLLYQNGDEDVQLLQVLKRYASICDHVEVILTDINKNPGILTRFVGDEETAVAADSVVVYCPATDRYQVLDYNDFLSLGYDINTGTFVQDGLAYEKRLTEAIVYVSRENLPTAGFLQGHGELSMDALAVLTGFMEGNSIQCTEVNLLAGDSLENIDILFITGLQKDLTPAELEELNMFAQNGGSIFITRDYTDPLEETPNYLALLRSYGVVPMDGVVVAGKEDAGSYYGDEPIWLLPYMNEMDMLLPLTLNGYDVLLMPASSAFETPGETGDASLSVGTVLRTGPNAYLRNLDDTTLSIERQPDDPAGEFSLAIYAHRMHYNGNISRLFALGNSATITDEFMYQSTYVEEFLTVLFGEMIPQSNVSLNVMSKSAFHPALMAGDHAFGVVVLVGLPLLVLICALWVLLPRYNR